MSQSSVHSRTVNQARPPSGARATCASDPRAGAYGRDMRVWVTAGAVVLVLAGWTTVSEAATVQVKTDAGGASGYVSYLDDVGEVIHVSLAVSPARLGYMRVHDEAGTVE